jgi:hypothetical protein
MLVAAGKERRSFAAALAAIDDADPFAFYLTCQSFYARQLDLYLAEFPAERILVLDQAALLREREATLGTAFSFLGVDPAFSSAEFEDELFQGGQRRRYPPLAARLKPLLRRPFKALPEGLRERLQGSVEGALFETVPKPEIAERERGRLGELFAPDAARLRRLTGLELSGWSV